MKVSRENSDEIYLYFAHPIRTYGTKSKIEVLRAIHEEYPGYKITDPEDMRVQESISTCKECMQKVMKKYFFPQIEKSSLFIIWNPYDTCGITCELHYAWQLGKNCIYASYFADEVDFEDLSLQEYHKIANYAEVV
jgi:hypothetical protein